MFLELGASKVNRGSRGCAEEQPSRAREPGSFIDDKPENSDTFFYPCQPEPCVSPSSVWLFFTREGFRPCMQNAGINIANVSLVTTSSTLKLEGFPGNSRWSHPANQTWFALF